MRKISNFCGIFATLFVTTTIILLASCSQDDDYYDNSEMYTLAGEMGTRSGGGDPGGQPSPVITYVTETPITEENVFYFYADTVFYSSAFQNSPFVAINPSLYGGTYIEVDVETELRRNNNVPTVSSYVYYPIQIVTAPTPASVPDSILGFIYESEPISNADFEVSNVYLQLNSSTPSNRYTLYATGVHYKENGETVPCTAFIPNRIYN